MNKCPHCMSCLKITWYGTKVYRYCTLCRTVYSVTSDSTDEVTDPFIIDVIRKMYGQAVT